MQPYLLFRIPEHRLPSLPSVQSFEIDLLGQQRFEFGTRVRSKQIVLEALQVCGGLKDLVHAAGKEGLGGDEGLCGVNLQLAIAGNEVVMPSMTVAWSS